jgi:hypothetical protein
MVRGLILAIALVATGEVRAEPSLYLKGVTAVTYKGIVETKTAHCAIDMKAWNTSIDFMVKQSTKLKFLRDYREWLSTSFEDASRHSMKSGSLPRLWFDLTSIELPGGCVGVIDAEVRADLEPSKPDFIIWSNKS